MFVLIVQTVLLLTIAFILGCILGCLLRRLFGAAEAPAASAAAPAAVGAGAAGIAAKAAVEPRSPSVPKPPRPSAPMPPKPETADIPAAAPVAPLISTSEPAPAKAARARPAAKKRVAKKAAPVSRDDLKRIRGIGPQNEGRLNNLGIHRFEQIAGWSKKDQAHYGEVLTFPGRIEREEWVKQARQLSKGEDTDFSKRVDSGLVSTSRGAAKAGNMGTKPSILSGPRDGNADNLTLIDGVGNALERKLFKLGVYHFDQIASWTESEQAWIGNNIGFPGRVERENWVGESKILAKGGMTEHAKRVERGEIKTSRKSGDDET